MKRSEFLDYLKRLMISTEWHNLDAAGTLAEEAGIEWDPEELGLPRVLAIKKSAAADQNAVLVAPGFGNLALEILPGHPWWALIQAAFNAYNREQAGELSDRDELLSAAQPGRPADVISKTRGGETVHYAIGPVRATREEAEKDLREWFGKEPGRGWEKVPFPPVPGTFMVLPLGVRANSPEADAFLREIEHGMEGWRRIKEAMEYLDPSDTVYRILSGEEP